MFAIVELGGKQYKIEEDQVLRVEKQPGDPGETLKIDRVLLLNDGDSVLVGDDIPDTTTITAEILNQARGQKLYVFKYKRRKGSRKKTGHRQHYTELKIKEIEK